MKIRRFVAAGLLAGTAAVAVPTLASAATASPGQARFCHEYAVFGEHSTLPNLNAVHAASLGANAGTKAAYSRFQAALLEGMPTSILRNRAYAVWSRCGR